jgi:hypothetical protein
MLSKLEFSFSSCVGRFFCVHEYSVEYSISPDTVVANGELTFSCSVVELQFTKGGKSTDLLNCPQSDDEEV